MMPADFMSKEGTIEEYSGKQGTNSKDVQRQQHDQRRLVGQPPVRIVRVVPVIVVPMPVIATVVPMIIIV